MNKRIYEKTLNKVLIGLAVFVVFIVAIFLFIEYYEEDPLISENEAFQIALHSKLCNQGNTSIVNNGFYNSKKKVWEFNINLEGDSDLIRDNCDGICIVSTESKIAKLDLRCFNPVG